MLLFHLLILLRSSLAQETIEAWPLQFHCGQQTLRKSGDLNYGLLVYQLLPYSNAEEPNVIFFRSESTSPEQHPFCQIISSAMKQNLTLLLTFSDTKELSRIERSPASLQSPRLMTEEVPERYVPSPLSD